MAKDVIITSCKAGKRGVAFTLNKPSRTKHANGTGMATTEHWISWDAIGEAVFENYNDLVSVEDRDALRKSSQ